MILGEGFLADGARAAFPNINTFTWILDHPTLIDRDYMPDEIVVISTPILVGTIAKLEANYPETFFAYMPENVREAHPADWHNQDRFIVGTRHRALFATQVVRGRFKPAMFMSPESAEMVKHALNGFLGMSIAYSDRIAKLASQHGADPQDVASGMMSDRRIGQGAYLKPNGPEVGPNIQRELDNLDSL